MRKFLRLLWMALLLLIVALLSALTAMRLAIHGREVTVPDFQGRTPAEARRIADDNGLATEIEREYYSPTVPRGRVLSQMPAAGTIVRRGWELRLALSLGPQRVAIPQVVGQSARAAAISINQRGLDPGSSAVVQIPGVPAGQVIAQNPPPNATDVAVPKISLLIAQETFHQAFVMPSFVGQPLGSATIILQTAGFPAPRAMLTPPAVPAAPATPAVPTAPSAAAPNAPAVATTPVSPDRPAPAAAVGTPSANPVATGPAAASPVVPSPVVPPPASIIVSQVPAPGARVLAGSPINFIVRD